jgi:hypothetical protein
MSPELARRIISEFSAPGDLVVDPACGVGTTLVEAVALGRRAVGAEATPGGAAQALENLARAAAPNGAVPVLADLTGRADLVCTMLASHPGRSCQDAIASAFAVGARLLRAGGVLVTVTKHRRHAGRAQDMAGRSVELGRAAGLAYVGHVIALQAAVADGALTARPSAGELARARRLRAGGEPVHLAVHQDVVVFRQGGAAHAG